MEPWKERFAKFRYETRALYMAARDRRVPWYARALAGLVVAYALSPIDLIPDFIPVLGHLDDLVLVPAGLALAIRLIPREIRDEHRAAAEREAEDGSSVSYIGGVIVLATWLVAAAWLGSLAWRVFACA